MGKASDTGGVKPMNIAGRLVSDRERLLGMTDAERAFRKQWLQDQILSHNEPRVVPQIYKETYNPIRRFYRWPLNQVEKALAPLIGTARAQTFRYVSAKLAMSAAIGYWMWYYFKYNSNTWEKRSGFQAQMTRINVVPGDPGYPQVSNRTKGSDYASRGFEKVTLNL